jgi:IS30 family transposase
MPEIWVGTARGNADQEIKDVVAAGVERHDDQQVHRPPGPSVAAELNDRPRKRLEFQAPSEILGAALLR